MNTDQAARYARLSELLVEFDKPDGLFALAEAIATIEVAWSEDQEHFVRLALLEVIVALVNRRRFPDVAQALVQHLLSLDPDRNSLLAAARVAEWSGDATRAAELTAEAALAPDALALPAPFPRRGP